MDKPVSYELAELLKEKGFNLKVVNYYHFKKLSLISDKERHYKGLTIYNPINWNQASEHYTSAPTISTVITWLYEKHNIWINVNHWTNQPMDDEIWENCFQGFVDGDAMDARYYKTPTEAYESAIKYSLGIVDIKLIYMEYSKNSK